MASILPVGSRWRAQVRKRGQSIAKTFKTESAAEAWAREREAEIDKGHNAVDAATVTVGELVRKIPTGARRFKARSGAEIERALHTAAASTRSGRRDRAQGLAQSEAIHQSRPGSGREERTVEASESGLIIKVEAAAVVAVIQPA
ncbi:hypothetical protein ACTJLC_22140 [Paraburkholderia sp. 22099]|jgi:hypothetical protein|uniref:hypothetical protein n=1 Tax=Paraburkholderia TaxID=1822464 RepID=UPI001F345627|nr:MULTISPECIES: hypothetical protein [Paraburkholderia]MDR6493520.1 hypothetical protein [Paraburkholderia terricola]